MKIELFTKGNFQGLGATLINGKPTIFFRRDLSNKILTAQSDDGENFEIADITLTISDIAGSSVVAEKLIGMRSSPLFKNHILLFEQIVGDSKQTFSAISSDNLKWTVETSLPEGTGTGLNVENYVFNDQHVFYFGGKQIALGLTDEGESWRFRNVVTNGNNNFSEYDVDFVTKTNQGIFILYHTYSVMDDKNHLEVKAILTEKENPTNLIWETKSSLWQEPDLWNNKKAFCLGCIYFNGRLLSYWNVPDIGIFLITYPIFTQTPAHENNHYKLEKHSENPVLTPDPTHTWENEAVFNPAAFYDNGKVYLIYRAVGYGYISVLGYAESSDGIHFENRRHEPIFTGESEFDSKSPNANVKTASRYLSGGSYGGIEDPRVTKIDDRLYLVYVAFNGFDPPRLALTSILYKDFINQRFLWEKPVLISPPGIVDKSGCILPEKINGKYVIFHRVFPNILIDYVDDLSFDGTKWLKGEFKIEPRPTMWDSRKVGIGAPPIKTADGWLLIYQGVTDKDDSKYKIGAMLLDLHDPTKVLHRTNHPIIEPTEYYENGLSKFGVVYPCGAVIKDGKLMVYYGGSDSVTCVATADLDDFMDELKSGNGAKLTPIKIND